MVDVQTISMVIAAASVVIGVVIGVAQLRDLKRTRQAELFVPLFDRVLEGDWMRDYSDIMQNWEWRDFDNYMEKYGWATNLEAQAKLMKVATFFHCTGALLKRRQIDPVLVSYLIQTMTIQFWEKFEQVIKEWRKLLNFPRLYWAVEYLHDEMKRMEQLEAASR